MIKQFFLLCALVILCVPAFAENNTIDKRVNSSSTQDRYNLPEYDVFNTKKMFQKTKNRKNNAPALTIVNEPYMPHKSIASSNLNHMGQAKENTAPQSLLVDENTKIETPPLPVPLKEEAVASMPSSEPVQSYTPESLTSETITIDTPSMPLTPEPLPVQEVASLDAAAPMPLEPIMNQESLPQRSRFYALAGTSLRESLRAWAGTQEFALVWDTPRDFRVKQTISSNADSEMALRDILSMYDGDAVRPIGKLYRDARTSRPVLVIKSDK